MKQVRLAVVLSGFIALGLSTNASASLIQQDLLAAGDGLVTLDTETNLQWLDLMQSYQLTFNQVTDGTHYWTGLGFNVASGDQVSRLFQDAFGNVITPGPASVPVTNAQVIAFSALVDVTARASDPGGALGADFFSSGMYQVNATQISFASAAVLDLAKESANAWIQTAPSSLTFRPSYGGAWLVRSVPEPGTLPLLGAGLVGLFFLRRRRAAA